MRHPHKFLTNPYWLVELLCGHLHFSCLQNFGVKPPMFKRHLKMAKEKLLSIISTPELVQKVQAKQLEHIEHRSKLLRIKQVLELYPVGRSTLYKMIAENRFPKQISLSAKSVAWREIDVISFINSLKGVK